MGESKEKENCAFERCAEFLARMYQKYAPLFETVSVEEIRRLFGDTQCKCK